MHRCEPPYKRKCWTTSLDPLYQSLFCIRVEVISGYVNREHVLSLYTHYTVLQGLFTGSLFYLCILTILYYITVSPLKLASLKMESTTTICPWPILDSLCWVANPCHFYTLQRKSDLCIPFLGIARPESQFPYSCVCERFIYSKDWSTYVPAANRQTDLECRNWEIEHYNSDLKIRRLHTSAPFHFWEYKMGTRHLYRILASIHLQCRLL